MSKRDGKQLLSLSLQVRSGESLRVEEQPDGEFDILCIDSIAPRKLGPNRSAKPISHSSVAECDRRGKRRIVHTVLFGRKELSCLRELLNELHELGKLD